MSQLRRDSYHLVGDYASDEFEAREKTREIVARLLARIKNELTNHITAPLAVTDPLLLAQLSADQWLADWKESWLDRAHLRERLLEGLKQLLDAVDEVKENKVEDVARHVSSGSKVRDAAWSIFTDLDVARGFVDVVNAVSLRARNRALDDRQVDLDRRYAYIKGEVQRCIDAIRRQRPTGGAPPANIKNAQQSKTPPPQPTTDWSALDQGVLKDWPAEDMKGLEGPGASPAPKIGQKAPHVPEECAYLKKPYTVESSKPNFDRIRKSTSLSKAKEIKYMFPGDDQDRNALEYEVDVGGRKKKLIVPKDPPTNKALPAPEQLAAALGTVPGPQLDNIKQIVASPNPNPDNAYWARQYNIPNFSSAATGGASGVTFYPQPKWSQESTDSTMIHEGGHTYSTSLWADESKKAAWKKAIHKDGRSPSKYADSSTDEDFSESLVMYSLSKGTQCEKAAKALYPNRYKALNDLFEVKSP
jgi:hypothetical protein